MFKQLYKDMEKLRAALLSLYPNGFVRSRKTESGVVIAITNFSDKPLYLDNVVIYE